MSSFRRSFKLISEHVKFLVLSYAKTHFGTMWRVKRLIESLVGTLRLVRSTFAANEGKFWQNYTYTSWPPKLTIMAHFKLRLNLVLPCPHPPAWYEKSGVFCGLFTNNGHLFLLLYIYLGTIFSPLYLFLWKLVGILDSLNLNREKGRGVGLNMPVLFF